MPVNMCMQAKYRRRPPHFSTAFESAQRNMYTCYHSSTCLCVMAATYSKRTQYVCHECCTGEVAGKVHKRVPLYACSYN